LAAALLAACQSDDVGTACKLDLSSTVTCDPTNDTADYFESSAASTCDNLVCIHSAGEGCTSDQPPAFLAVCSKPCVSDSDCSNGTVCRQIVLDPTYIDSLPPNVRQLFLGDIQSSTFCALPSP
jgi:hypothetical protein